MDQIDKIISDIEKGIGARNFLDNVPEDFEYRCIKPVDINITYDYFLEDNFDDRIFC